MIYLYFLAALAATIVIEGAVALLWLRSRSGVYHSVLCNLLTNPALNLLLWLGVSAFGQGCYWYLLAALELAVVAVEAWIMRELSTMTTRCALLLSLTMNTASWLAGFLYQALA